MITQEYGQSGIFTYWIKSKYKTEIRSSVCVSIYTIHGLWMERNGEKLLPTVKLIRFIDRNTRNRFLSIQRAGDAHLEGGLSLRYWFSTRPVS